MSQNKEFGKDTKVTWIEISTTRAKDAGGVYDEFKRMQTMGQLLARTFGGFKLKVKDVDLRTVEGIKFYADGKLYATYPETTFEVTITAVLVEGE